MLEWSLANLAAWSVQAASLVVAGAWLPTKLRLGVPRARLLLFRVLLVGCVGLPLVQPWRATPVPPPAPADASVSLPSLDAGTLAPASSSSAASAPPAVPITARLREWAATVPWTLVILGVLAAGAAVRLAWLALGLVSLARLRRASTAIDPPTAPMADAALAVGVSAAFRQSPRVPRPVTFGLRSPVVIVPPGFTALEAKQQEAVACHELLHVRRQDWLRILGDEVVRGLLWFHPGIWWLVEQIHLTAEQTIDREVVAIVGDRRPYLRALLALAESGNGPRLQPAACFLDHGHLRQRVAMLMEEASMSRVRLAASFVFVLAVVSAGAWWSVSAFPLRGASASLLPAVPIVGSAAAVVTVIETQPPPPQPPLPPPPPQRATLPGVMTAPTGAAPDEATLKRNIQLNPRDLSNYYVLAMLYEKAGDLAKAEATYQAAIKASPNSDSGYMQAAGFYNRHDNFDKAMEALKRRMAVEPQNPEAAYTIAAYYWERAYRHTELPASERMAVIQDGLQAVDRALALRPEYAEALTYKNLLLRSQSLLETDEGTKQELIAEADKLRDQAIAIRKVRAGGTAPFASVEKMELTAGDRVGLAASTVSFLASQLADARAQLRLLEQRHTKDHPDVVRLKQVVAQLEIKLADATARAAAEGAGAVPPPPPPPPPLGGKVQAGAPVPPDAPPPPPPPVDADGKVAPVRVGGTIQPPTKIVDAKPVMPDLARTARVQGVVIVEATIGEDGKVRDVKVLRSIPLLDQAAVECVRKWEFTPTYLNGVAVPVIMTATVNFTVDQ